MGLRGEATWACARGGGRRGGLAALGLPTPSSDAPSSRTSRTASTRICRRVGGWVEIGSAWWAEAARVCVRRGWRADGWLPLVRLCAVAWRALVQDGQDIVHGDLQAGGWVGGGAQCPRRDASWARRPLPWRACLGPPPDARCVARTLAPVWMRGACLMSNLGRRAGADRGQDRAEGRFEVALAVTRLPEASV